MTPDELCELAERIDLVPADADSHQMIRVGPELAEYFAKVAEHFVDHDGTDTEVLL